MALASSPHRRGLRFSRHGPRLTVLCIAAEADDPHGITLQLRSQGMAVLRAFSPEQGYWLALDNAPDAIVIVGSSSDPRVRLVLRRFASHILTQDTPIVLLEENGTSTEDSALAELGVVARLPLAAAASQVMAVVGDHLCPAGLRKVASAAG